jgi:hypothetical protein
MNRFPIERRNYTRVILAHQVREFIASGGVVKTVGPRSSYNVKAR